MNTIFAIALVCSAGVTSDACNDDTALDRMVLKAVSSTQCFQYAMTTAAGSGVVDGRYLKIVCRPQSRLAQAQ